ncbi:MAG: hypothetical protein WA624_01425 [Methylocella sp.]
MIDSTVLWGRPGPPMRCIVAPIPPRAAGAGPIVPRSWLADTVAAGRCIALFCKIPRIGHIR